MNSDDYFQKSWIRFPFDSSLYQWVQHALPYARKAINATDNQQWLRCGGTWFAGVNVLNNDENGSVDNGPSIAGECIDFIDKELGFQNISWDAGQVSVCYPGYPKPMASESNAAFSYRLKRDAAHVDGLLPGGPERRRHLREHHGFILGIPLVETSQGASPLVVWQGSHEIIRQTFKRIYSGSATEAWGDIDITDCYQQARRLIFADCERVEVFARPGECYLIHRLALHGVSPWQQDAIASSDGRMICYFRPETVGPEQWLNNL